MPSCPLTAVGPLRARAVGGRSDRDAGKPSLELESITSTKRHGRAAAAKFSKYINRLHIRHPEPAPNHATAELLPPVR